MKITKLHLLLMTLMLSVLRLHSETPILPPELSWWLAEAQKANKDISIGSFKQTASDSAGIQTTNKLLTPTFPVFIRWNYSANKYAYFNDGLVLSRMSDGRYSVKHEQDTAFYIADNRNKIIFEEHYGSRIEIDGIAWLRDDTLIAVSHVIRKNNDDSAVDLYISQYVISKDRIEIKTYAAEAVFKSDDLSKLNMNWWQQRYDYFSDTRVN